MPRVTSEETGRKAHETSQQRKKRVRHFTADDRAAHRIIEKERREAFRERLSAFAHLLPALSDKAPQTLSKHTVVEEGISHVVVQNARLDEAAQNMRALAQERDELLSELNQWRSQAGISLRQPRETTAYSLERIGPEASPARNPAPVDSPLGTVPGSSDLSVLPEVGQANVSHASLCGNALPEPFGAGGAPAPVSAVNNSHVALGLNRPLEDLMIGETPQQPAQTELFNNSGCLNAAVFDTTFVLEALQPSRSLDSVLCDPADMLNFTADPHTNVENYLV
ncbi:hypothetical protein VP1G_00597 [Cytospora mali]|uniref:BHLH domain-containing protein n=1 Tax=Cytospora mali TaxID=578113 RepID=A0A194UNX6_CYTMA|nr:hypothetical protein VP1G_00597 [Valsa mali var. pyri (nom. inval.)]